MKTTDYSKIANKYENNQYRKNELRYDDALRNYIDNNVKNEYQVLDLSCGTGLYLEKQMNSFKGLNIKWNGLDASKEMLDIAAKKLDEVALVKSYAEEMPYKSETFDFISNNYAFHHYENKGYVFDEIYRVLIKGGIYKLHNIAIHDMPNWWIYHYFPSAFYEDLKRYWDKGVIFNELKTRGLEVSLNIEYRMEEVKVKDYLNFAVNRDISVLTLIKDKDYEEGLERIIYDLKGNPNKTMVTDFAEIFCFAKKM